MLPSTPSGVVNVVILKSDDPIAEPLEGAGADRITFYLFIRRMRCAVDLDDKPPLATYEIGNIVADRLLANELEILQLTVVELRPQLRFSARRFTPQSPGNGNIPAIGTAHMMRLAQGPMPFHPSR